MKLVMHVVILSEDGLYFILGEKVFELRYVAKRFGWEWVNHEAELMDAAGD